MRYGRPLSYKFTFHYNRPKYCLPCTVVKSYGKIAVPNSCKVRPVLTASHCCIPDQPYLKILPFPYQPHFLCSFQFLEWSPSGFQSSAISGRCFFHFAIVIICSTSNSVIQFAPFHRLGPCWHKVDSRFRICVMHHARQQRNRFHNAVDFRKS